MKIYNFLIFLILISSFCIRIGYIIAFNELNRAPQNDEIEYYLLASHLCKGKGFVVVNGQPYAFRPPGYPFYLATLCFIFGPSIPVYKILNVILDTISCLLVSLFVKRITTITASILSGLIFSFHPVLIYFSGLIYPETLLIMLISLLIFIFTFNLNNKYWLNAVMAGIIIGYMVHIRPNWVFWAPGIILWFLTRSIPKNKKIKNIIAFLFVINLSMMPWMIRNYLNFGEIIFISTIGGVTFWGGNNALANGGWIEPSPFTWEGKDPPVDMKGWTGLTEKESETRFYAAAFEWILNNPVAFISLLPKKLQRAFSLNFSNQYRSINIPFFLFIIYYAYLFGALIGVFMSFYDWKKYILLYNLVIVMIITTLLFYGSTRQSMPMIIPTIVFVSIALSKVIDRLRILKLKFVIKL